MNIKTMPMTIADYDAVINLWKKSDGIGLSAADEPGRIAAFLEHNPDMSFVACDGDLVVGAVLCGSDGRRGYLHHLAVRPDYRNHGVGTRLVDECLKALKSVGIDKVHIFVYKDNQSGIDFWSRIGWEERTTLMIMSQDL